MRTVFILKQNIWLICLLERNLPEELGLFPQLNGSSGLQMGTGAGVYGQFVGRRIGISLGKHAAVFQAEEYAILVCVHEIDTQERPEKFVSICSDSQASLNALQATRPTSPLARHCQKMLNDIFFFLLGESPASVFYWPTFRNSLSVPSS
jgi:hypothetical protein